ncbi:MAG: polysaccharide deacetylase family protein [Ruminococcus sp.]|nr:polysaccharide deacetylase family protein [Ruminococcus sp.]
MYECCNFRRFVRLLILDAVIFSLCAVFFLIGRSMIGSAEENAAKPVPLPVIMYHSVREGQPGQYSVTPEQLGDDLSWLAENGFTSVTAQELIGYTLGENELPERPVLITFDDGFYNNLSAALPLLEKYDMYAVVSVVGSYTEKLAAADPHSPAYSYLTWEDIAELAASGRVEIGDHTYDMHSLYNGRRGCGRVPGEDAEDYALALRADIGLMQTELHEHLGCAPVVFAYPFGEVSPESVPVLRELGFRMTLTCRERVNLITRAPDCLFGLSRFNRSGLYSTGEFMELLTKDLKNEE